jgi:hypothetical protein
MVVIEMTWLLKENQKTDIWAKPKNAKAPFCRIWMTANMLGLKTKSNFHPTIFGATC